MNVCLVTTEFPPGPMGGVGTYSAVLPPLLAAAGHTVVVVTKRFHQDPLIEQQGAVTVYRLDPTNEGSGRSLWEDPDRFATEMTHVRSYVGVFANEVARQLPRLHAKHCFDVILSQDVEAPMYFHLTNRLLFNTMHAVPVVLVLHSPHNQVQYFNDAPIYERREYHRTMYESQAIAMADRWIVPSLYLRDLVISDMGLDTRRLVHIPLPLGETPQPVPTSQRIGAADAPERLIVYAGRIELRKGVEDLIKAAVPLLAADPNLCLHLAGRDCDHPTLGGTVSDHLSRKRIPAELRSRVRFLGGMPRERLWAEYARATVGVVPSRWENFPFTCMEMMSCGTPVVATRAGGMAEMIEDGVSGLLCEADDPPSLRAALQRALTVPAEQRAAWGAAAAQRVRAYCENARVIQSTVDTLQTAVTDCAGDWARQKRFPIPSNWPFGDQPLARPHALAGQTPPPVIRRLAAVIPCYNMGEFIEESIASLLAQERRPDLIVVVDDGSTNEETLIRLRTWERHEIVQVHRFENGGLPVARNRGAAIAIEQQADAMMFLDADDMIATTYLRKAAEVLERHPEAGAVTAWTASFGLMQTYWAPPPAQFPFLLAENISSPPALVRTTAFQAVGGFCPGMKYAYEDWDFWISVAERGYAILMIPEPLIQYRMRTNSMFQMFSAATREHGRRGMAARHPALFERFGNEVILLLDGQLNARHTASDVETLQRELQRVQGQRDFLGVEVDKCQKFIAYLQSLPRRPLEAVRYATSVATRRLKGCLTATR